jgi:phage terminase large subunit
MIELPEIIRLPKKLLPIITNFNDYKYFVIEGGRGSGKSQSIARLILYLCEIRQIRVVCGREIQNTISESVHTLFADLIRDYSLNFEVQDKVIYHAVSGSVIRFKGFREQGSVNIKGVEGADIVWVDEAQSLTKLTLDTIIPTLRKENPKLIFTLNRHTRDDAVMALTSRADCLHIKINYFENEFCPHTLKVEAQVCKEDRGEREYAHIWLGEPLSQTDEYLFDSDKLEASLSVEAFGSLYISQRVVGIDFAAQGNDSCVATILDRRSGQHWELVERIRWQEPDSMSSVGRIVNLLGQYRPDIAILDVGGMGHVVHNRLTEIGVTIQRFDGASSSTSKEYLNARAEGYYQLRDWFEKGFLRIKKEDRIVLTELEKIKMKYRSDGRRVLQAKLDMKKELGYSPDNADSLMMAVYGAVMYLGKNAETFTSSSSDNIRVISGSRRHRR